MGRGTNPSRIALSHSGGEIIQVHGGHILRSIGRKDRHSKVCTSKGPRDRRVRLSAHTAIQFYDVQDRLGYDRPSKAVDWLIKKAKAAIDQLGELPAWFPPASSFNLTEENQPQPQPQPQPQGEEEFVGEDGRRVLEGISSNTRMAGSDLGGESAYQQGEIGGNDSGMLPPSMHADDPIQLFFPVGASSSETNSSSMQFQNFLQPGLLSRTCNQSEDLRLSLQSFQQPILHHRQHHTEQTLYSGNPQLVFDPTSGGWSEEQHSTETGHRFNEGGGGGFMFSTAARMLQQPMLGQNQIFSQGGPLQSSNTQTVRGWIDPSPSTSDHQSHHHIHQSPFAGMGFASGGGISGFGFPARIQGQEEEEEEEDKPSSASSDSQQHMID